MKPFSTIYVVLLGAILLSGCQNQTLNPNVALNYLEGLIENQVEPKAITSVEGMSVAEVSTLIMALGDELEQEFEFIKQSQSLDPMTGVALSIGIENNQLHFLGAELMLYSSSPKPTSSSISSGRSEHDCYQYLDRDPIGTAICPTIQCLAEYLALALDNGSGCISADYGLLLTGGYWICYYECI